MREIKGVGVRIAERMRAVGYWDDKKRRLRVIDFSETFGINHSYIYRWLGGEVPTAKYLFTLARALEVTPESLVENLPRKRGSRTLAGLVLLALTAGSVPAAHGTMQGIDSKDDLRLIGTWRRRLWWLWPSGFAPVAA